MGSMQQQIHQAVAVGDDGPQLFDRQMCEHPQSVVADAVVGMPGQCKQFSLERVTCLTHTCATYRMDIADTEPLTQSFLKIHFHTGIHLIIIHCKFTEFI